MATFKLPASYTETFPTVSIVLPGRMHFQSYLCNSILNYLLLPYNVSIQMIIYNVASKRKKYTILWVVTYLVKFVKSCMLVDMFLSYILGKMI